GDGYAHRNAKTLSSYSEVAHLCRALRYRGENGGAGGAIARGARAARQGHYRSIRFRLGGETQRYRSQRYRRARHIRQRRLSGCVRGVAVGGSKARTYGESDGLHASELAQETKGRQRLCDENCRAAESVLDWRRRRSWLRSQRSSRISRVSASSPRSQLPPARSKGCWLPAARD